MEDGDKAQRLPRVLAHRTRKCPYCQSNKWRWLGAVPITPDELARHLLTRYLCEKCGKEFLAEEAERARYVASAATCVHCGSSRVEKTSKPDADLEIWR
ncbi:MAG: hypothetical protein NTW86_10475, partial [Candidatus Sumerlaeota bacterium]|nr:hypothetical protein [Candidatus Sumerlaeota bacterium]